MSHLLDVNLLRVRRRSYRAETRSRQIDVARHFGQPREILILPGVGELGQQSLQVREHHHARIGLKTGREEIKDLALFGQSEGFDGVFDFNNGAHGAEANLHAR